MIEAVIAKTRVALRAIAARGDDGSNDLLGVTALRPLEKQWWIVEQHLVTYTEKCADAGRRGMGLDDALKLTFPASDPVALSPTLRRADVDGLGCAARGCNQSYGAVSEGSGSTVARR